MADLKRSQSVASTLQATQKKIFGSKKMKRHQFFLLLLLLKTTLCTYQNFNLLSGYMIEGKYQSQEQDNFLSACECRQKCFTEPECRAVSIPWGSSPGDVTCGFLLVGGDEVRPLDYLKEDSQTRTYVKGFSCYPPMQIIKDVDCLFISSIQMTQREAKTTGCASPMKLYAPPSEDVFLKLADFLKKENYPGDYWLWLERLENGTWVWDDGKYVYGTDTYEEGVWGGGNPGSDNCAKMKENSDFKMSDRTCDEPYFFICGMA
ncbi:C-type lectin-like [Trinorchestia longiramus]|nr:C-type lectin-like [Trinorchestia longiramus]